MLDQREAPERQNRGFAKTLQPWPPDAKTRRMGFPARPVFSINARTDGLGRPPDNVINQVVKERRSAIR